MTSIADGASGQSSEACFGEEPTVFGTSADDFLVGTDGRDVIHAGAGNDIIVALEGQDRVCAGAGRDVVIGGVGADAIQGEGGSDLLFGSEGRDTLIAQDGDDRVFGGPGRDTLTGGDGTDYLDGGRGFDFGFGDSDNCTGLQGLCGSHCVHVIGLALGPDVGSGFGELVSAQVSEETDYGFEIAIVTSDDRAFGFVDRRPANPGATAIDFPAAEMVGTVHLERGVVVSCSTSRD